MIYDRTLIFYGLRNNNNKNQCQYKHQCHFAHENSILSSFIGKYKIRRVN